MVAKTNPSAALWSVPFGTFRHCARLGLLRQGGVAAVLQPASASGDQAARRGAFDERDADQAHPRRTLQLALDALDDRGDAKLRELIARLRHRCETDAGET